MYWSHRRQQTKTEKHSNHKATKHFSKPLKKLGTYKYGRTVFQASVVVTKKHEKIYLHWKMNGWNLQPSPMNGKENHLNQTSRELCSMLFFRGVFLSTKKQPNFIFFRSLKKQNNSFQNQPKKQAFPKGWNFFQGHRSRIFGKATCRRHIRPTLWRPRAARREDRPRRRWGRWRSAKVGMTEVDQFGGGFPESDAPRWSKKWPLKPTWKPQILGQM